jgi:death on curing protein
VIYLTASELLRIAERTIGALPVARDLGLLESAAARPQATFDGAPVYPDLISRAAALMHSLARNHPLVDGNKRLALAAAIVFLGVNGHRLTLSNDEAYELTMAVASGRLDDVGVIAQRLRAGSRQG